MVLVAEFQPQSGTGMLQMYQRLNGQTSSLCPHDMTRSP